MEPRGPQVITGTIGDPLGTQGGPGEPQGHQGIPSRIPRDPRGTPKDSTGHVELKHTKNIKYAQNYVAASKKPHLASFSGELG